MAKAKSFDNMTNPADTLLQGINAEPTTSTPERAAERASQEADNRRKPADERKSERLGLLVRPATARDIKLIASLENTSMNDILNKLMTDYIADYQRQHGDKLNMARGLFK